MAGEAPEYSRHLGRIRPEQFQAALTRFGLGTFVSAEPIGAGITGQNCFVTGTAGPYVLRGRPHWPGQFEEERFLAEQIHTGTRVPAPWPYLVDAGTDIFGWPYALMPRMPGQPLPWPESFQRRDAATRLAVARALGEGLGLLQELRWPFAGAFDAGVGAVLPFPTSLGERVAGLVRQRLEEVRAVTPERVGDADVAYVAGIVRRTADALAMPREPCFVMPDYKEDNLVVEAVQGG